MLNLRPAKSAAKYARIWLPEGSPLKVHTERQATLLKAWLGEAGTPDVAVAWAMRYGSPSIPAMLDQLKAAGAERVLVVPMYPQYAASSSGSVMDDVADWIKRTRNPTEIRFDKHFHDDPGYIASDGATVREYWAANGQPDKLLKQLAEQLSLLKQSGSDAVRLYLRNVKLKLFTAAKGIVAEGGS